MLKELHVTTDTNEQKPRHTFDGKILNGTRIYYGFRKLQTFDYCVENDWTETGGETVIPNFAIEWKSIPDFISSFTEKENKRREYAKIQRARAWEPLGIFYVLGGYWKDILEFDYSIYPSGRVTPRGIRAIMRDLRYDGVQIIESANSEAGQYEYLSLLKNRARDIKALQKKEAKE